MKEGPTESVRFGKGGATARDLPPHTLQPWAPQPAKARRGTVTHAADGRHPAAGRAHAGARTRGRTHSGARRRSRARGGADATPPLAWRIQSTPRSWWAARLGPRCR
eukprot:1774754-Prymnesium_polylepis.1